MVEELRRWWGFRLRVTSQHLLKPLSRGEIVLLFSLLSSSLLCGWLALVVFLPGMLPGGVLILWKACLVATVAVLLPLGLGWICPRGLLDSVKVTPWLVLSRQRGNMRSSDWVSVGVVGLAIAFMLIHFRLDYLPWTLALAISVSMSIILLLAQERILVKRKRKRVLPPDWLWPKEESETETGDEEQEESAEVEEGAQPVYEFKSAKDGKACPVGIAIDEDALRKLREINVEYHGVLYQLKTDAVVLVDRTPAEKVGQDDLLRFCRQIMTCGRNRGFTPFEFANAVLYFVQDAIKYEFDKDSTAQIPGGPYVEYGRFALETIKDSVGDCECTSIFASSLLSYLGYETAILFVTVTDPDTGQISGHAAVGLKAEGLGIPSEATDPQDYATDQAGNRYLYGETACDNHNIAFGTIPSCWKDCMTIDRVIPIPHPSV